MSGVILAVDTSNYTTSAALCDGSEVKNTASRLLPVEKGHLGLRQSEAVFHHVKALPEIISEALGEGDKKIDALAVSSRPRDAEGSYMPCFLAGLSAAKSLASVLKVPVFEFSHQSGHIAAAAYGAGRLDLLGQKFLAFHLSGGTTEAVMVTPDREKVFSTRIVAKTLDLNAGQAVDRVGGLCGLDFPAGIELERLALKGRVTESIKPSLKGNDCCLSGVVNRCEALLSNGASREDTARFCLEYIFLTLEKMTKNLLSEYGNLTVLYSGGVMSNSIIRDKMTEKFGDIALFSPPAFSRDNAAGISILGSIKYDG